jgi:PAS domain S-box-containing protein
MKGFDEQALQVQVLTQLLREPRPLAECADGLRRFLRTCPQVQEAWYLSWQPRTRTYAHEGQAGQLPPGQGDPLQASDQVLFDRLQVEPLLSLAALRQVPCWLAGRLRRAGVEYGRVLALPLLTGQSGVLLVALRESGPLDGLDGVLALLPALLPLSGNLPRSTPLLGSDPQPALLVDAAAQPVEFNPALATLLGEASLTEMSRVLPVNHPHLVRASLAQQRAIENVEVKVAARILVWTYIPEPAEQRVLVRCREATAEVLASRDAAQARRLYRLITENTTDLISRHTPDGRFLDASPASWTLLGYWPEELRGTLAHGLFHSQDIAQLVQRARDALEQDGYLTMTFRIRHREGHYLWFETACRAIRETYTGAVVEVVSVSRDVTARVQAEENRRRLAEVVEVNTDLVLFIQADGGIAYLNPAARQALQIEEGTSLELAALLGAADLDRLRNEGRATAEREGVWSGEVRLQPQGGKASLPVSLVLLAHSLAGGERYYSLVARDMTERELREAQQRRHQDELAHTARLVTLGELASGIAHEINQPLAAVVNYASASQRYLQTLSSNPQAPERIGQGLERITEHANHASQVIKRLRAFLRKGQRRMQALDVAQLAREAVRLCAWEASQAQVTIDEQLADNLPPVYADPVLIEQVLLNVLRNAIDANREAHPGSTSRILLNAQRHDGELRIGVSDQGPGASAEVLEQIFTPFYTSKAEGLGLGLSMSRSIVEGFGGALEAYPEANGGLRLECRLPLREATRVKDGS